MRKEVVGNCTLYLGDAREILPSLGYCADCVVSDPPYKLTSGGKNSGGLRGIFAPENYNNNGSIVECDITWPEIMTLYYGALKSGHCYTFSNDKNLRGMLNAADDAGFRQHNMLVWKKPNSVCNRWYMKNAEFVGLFFKGPAKYINDMGSKQLEEVIFVKETEHPTEKPVDLCQSYIENSTQPGEVVLDPFMGSGATAIGCLNTDRQFIGIESDELFFEMALERIKKRQNELIIKKYSTIELNPEVSAAINDICNDAIKKEKH